MKPTKSKRLIAVDSETGLCWYGENVMQACGVARALIAQNETSEAEHCAEQFMFPANAGARATA